MENSYSLKRKIMGQTQNQFHYYQINYNISNICFIFKEKTLFFFFALTHTLFVSHSQRKTFFALTHTNHLSRRQQHFAISSLTLFSSSFSFPHSSHWLSSWRQQYFALSSLTFFSIQHQTKPHEFPLICVLVVSLLVLPLKWFFFSLSWCHALFSLSPYEGLLG